MEDGRFWKNGAHHCHKRPMLGQRRSATNTSLFLGCLSEASAPQETHLKFTSYFKNFPIFCHILYANTPIPIIRTGTYASSAVLAMYCQNGPKTGTYNRSFRVHILIQKLLP